MLKISIGIPAYNEEVNIGRLLESLRAQKLEKVEIEEIMVIVSGSTDQTVEIVKRFEKKDKRIKLFRQSRRSGKTAADNFFLKKAEAEILVLLCADTLLKKNCLEKLVLPLSNQNVGITAAHMIPLNDKVSITGYFSHLWWDLFHLVAQEYFRAGEVLAFRKIVKRIPGMVGCDEVYLIDDILAQGYQAKYVSRAIAYNMGPQTIHDILMMRRRHACLHFQFAKFGPKVYYPKTMDNGYVFFLFLKHTDWHSPKKAAMAILCVFLEGLSRFLAYCDFYFADRKYLTWARALSTKKL